MDFETHDRRVIEDLERQVADLQSRLDAQIAGHRKTAKDATDNLIRANEAERALAERAGGVKHVAYFDDGQFHWMSGIAPRNCELYTLTTEPAAPEGRQEAVEALAEFLCSEFDFDLDPITGASWPEHEKDDGYRGNGYVRLQPSDVQARARENASRILTFISQIIRPSEQAVTEDWQPVDTAPHGVQVLLYTPPFACMGADAKHEMRVGCASWGEVIGGISNRSFDGHATYWRPLPNPPSTLKAAMEAGR